MFEYLGTVLVSVDPGFDVLRYLTVRTIGGTVTALLLSILMGPLIINSLKSMQFEQFVRKDGPQSHYKKTGTPTMGGLLILSSLIIVLQSKVYILFLFFEVTLKVNLPFHKIQIHLKKLKPLLFLPQLV